MSLGTNQTTAGARRPQSGRDLTTGSIPRHLVAFSTPMLAGSLLHTAYSLVNAFWVGKFLGTTALAAITVSMPAVFVLIAVAAGLTLATNIVIAQHYGARDWERLKSAVQTSIVLIGGSSFVFLVVGEIVARDLLVAINTPAGVLPSAFSYMRIFLLGLPFGFGFFLLASMLRGIGDSATPVYFQTVSVGLNIVLDPLLMFGLLGLPALGIAGAAWASVIAQAVGVAALVAYIQVRKPLVTPDWRRLRVEASTAWLLVRIGLPAMVQHSVVSVSLLVIVSFVSRFGENADAAFGAGLRIDQVSFLPAITIGAAISTLAGQNIGAKRYERVHLVFRWGLLVSVVISLLITVVVISIPGVLLRAFLNEPEVIAIGVSYLRIVGITYVLYAVLFASNGVINGAGYTTWTTLISVIGLWGVRLPLAYILPRRMHDVRGIWWAMLLSVGCSALLSLAYYATGRWKRPIIRAGQNDARNARSPDVV
ncbi:MAG: MATE family efflux transporter [Armatimonadota bacterium]|nr:MAG: MATE family efflux transporter [Armatimonadota bacterium]